MFYYGEAENSMHLVLFCHPLVENCPLFSFRDTLTARQKNENLVAKNDPNG
jgi:hypothetical protein